MWQALWLYKTPKRSPHFFGVCFTDWLRVYLMPTMGSFAPYTQFRERFAKESPLFELFAPVMLKLAHVRMFELDFCVTCHALRID
jgi:hypothetical protein